MYDFWLRLTPENNFMILQSRWSKFEKITLKVVMISIVRSDDPTVFSFHFAIHLPTDGLSFYLYFFVIVRHPFNSIFACFYRLIEDNRSRQRVECTMCDLLNAIKATKNNAEWEKSQSDIFSIACELKLIKVESFCAFSNHSNEKSAIKTTQMPKCRAKLR